MMSPPHSKQALLQSKVANDFVGLVKTNKAQLLTIMSEQLRDHLTDEQCHKLPSFQEDLLDATIRGLEDATEQMTKADLTHNQSLLNTQKARRDRDDLLKEIFTKIASLKQFVEGGRGAEALRLLGMSGETPRVPSDLVSWLAGVLDRLAQQPELPPSLLPSLVGCNVEVLEENLSPLHDALQKALEEVANRKAREALTLSHKREAFDKQHRLYASLASVAEAYASLCVDTRLYQSFCSHQVRRLTSLSKTKPKKSRQIAASGVQ